MKGVKIEDLENVSYAKVYTDEKKAKYDYRMPIFQNVGLDDTLISNWPVNGDEKISEWIQSNGGWAIII